LNLNKKKPGRLQKLQEKAILIALYPSGEPEYIIQAQINELQELIYTAGGRVVDVLVQKRKKPDPATVVGRGKLEEIQSSIEENEADFVVFENELTPIQMQNLEDILDINILDRTAVILDVFSQRALSKEGKLQVELAQMQYILPRLTGYGTKLSRLGGGIGTRGPGETKLEIDRRRIRKRISDLNNEISSIRKHRELHRQRRKREGSFIVSLVGYTNAGKSSLMNVLAESEVDTEDKLFATLDPTTRKLEKAREDNLPLLITDTVGFIRNMPEQVKAAFQATLEEISEANLILHVVDINHPEYPQQIEIVREMLNELNIDLSKEIIVFNKIDLLATNQIYSANLERTYPGCVMVSAKDGEGIDELVNLIISESKSHFQLTTFYVPHAKSDFLGVVQNEGGEVIEIDEHDENYFIVKARVDSNFYHKHYEYTADAQNIANQNGGQ